MRFLKLLLAFTLAILAAGCTSLQDQLEKEKSWEAKQFYDEGKRALLGQDYLTAIEYFEKLETRFPFGHYAQQAQLAAAFTYYKNNNPDTAISTAERFIKLYPTHPDVDYAFYIRGLAHYYSRDKFLDDVFNIDPARRDADSVRRSYQYFAELIQRYPDSRYAGDARQRMIYLREDLARNEIYVARYYMQRGAYLSAARRAITVIEQYPRTAAIPQALAIMVRAYSQLGVTDLAQDALRVLTHNFPEHREINALQRLVSAPPDRKLTGG